MVVIVILVIRLFFKIIFGRGLHILGYEYIFRIVLGWGYLPILWLMIRLSYFFCYNRGGGGGFRKGGGNVVF